MRLKILKNKKGYIALVSLLVVAAVGITISMAVSLRSMEELQMSFSVSQASKATSLADSCLEEGLNRLRQNWSNFGSLSLSIDSNSCIINITSFDANSATLEAFGDVDIFRQKILTTVSNNLEVTSWRDY